MTVMPIQRSSLAVAAGLVLAAACSKPPVPLAPAPATANQDSLALARARADSIARADSARQAEIARAQAAQDSLRQREQMEASQSVDAMKVISATIYYDYDQSVLTEAARSLLQAKVPLLQARPAMHLRITGHTDSRGSSEYNLALGLRRASEAKAFLVANGVDASRIDVASMGAEQPAVQGEGEDVWSKNRRSEFAPTTGGAAQ